MKHNNKPILTQRYKGLRNNIEYTIEVYETSIGILYREFDGTNKPSYSFQPPELDKIIKD